MKKSKDSAKKYTRKGGNINVWIPSGLKEAIQESAKQNFRNLNKEIVVGMVEYLEKRGLYSRDQLDEDEDEG